MKKRNPFKKRRILSPFAANLTVESRISMIPTPNPPK